MTRVDWKFSDHFGVMELLRKMLSALCVCPPNSESLISKGCCLVRIWIAGACNSYLAADSLYGVANAEDSFKLNHYREVSSKYGIATYTTARSSHFRDRANYLKYEVAKYCGIQGSKFLPVFHLYGPTRDPIAWIELVTTRRDSKFGINEHAEIKRELENINLTTSNSGGFLFVTEQGQSSAARGLQEEPCSLVSSTTKDKKVVSDGQNPSGPNKDISVPRESTIDLPSSGKTLIVSARLKDPRQVRLWNFGSAFTIEGLKKSVKDHFNWDKKARIEVVLRYVISEQGNTVPLTSDEHVMGHFGTSDPPVVLVIDVILKEDNVSAKAKKVRKHPGSSKGVRLDIDDNGFILAYEALRRIYKSGINEMMAHIIEASPSTVKDRAKKLIKRPPTPSPPDGLGSGEAATHKKMRTGEPSGTTHDTSGNSNADNDTTSYGDQQERQHSASEIPSNRGVINHVEQTCDTSVETRDGAEQELPHNVEPFSAPQKGENLSNGTDIRVAVEDDNQVIFYDEKGNKLDDEKGNKLESGGILSDKFAPAVLQGEEIGRDEASRYKEMRKGESSSTVDISGNSNVDKHASSLYGDQHGMQPLESALPMEENPSERHLGVETNRVWSTELDPALPPLEDNINLNWDDDEFSQLYLNWDAFSQLLPLGEDTSLGEEEPMLPSEENTDRISQRMKDMNRQWPSRLGI